MLDTEEEAKECLERYDRKIYDRLTGVFNDCGLQYRDAPQAYDTLTRARSDFERNCRPGHACTRMFVDQLMEAVEELACAMNKMRGGKDGEGQG